MLWTVWSCFILTAFVEVNSENTYTAYLPKYIRPGFEISYVLTVFNVFNPVRVTSNLSSSDDAFKLFSPEVNVSSGSSQQISLGTVPLDYSGNTVFTLHLVAFDTVSGNVIFSNVTNAFVYASKSLSTYIQTDKAIYQPGQTIKFRALCLKPDLRPLTGYVTYQVQDPDDNIVLLETNVLLSHGVAGGEFPLNKDSVVGDWKISYIVKGYKESLPVEVSVYKLPKFKVQVTIPSVIDATYDSLDVKLSATYTYGKPVDGLASLQIYRSYETLRGTWGVVRPGLQFDVDQSIKRNNNAFSGTWEVSIPKRELDTLWNGGNDATLAIVGSVTETLTGTSFNDTQTLSAKKHGIKVEGIYKPETIKPGLDYFAYARVTKQDGSLLTEAERERNNLILQMTYTFPSGYVVPGQATTPRPWERHRRSETQVYAVPPDGNVVISILADNDDFEYIAFELSTNSTSRQDSWTAYRCQSPSKSYLQITTVSSSMSPGDIANLTIKTTEAIRTFDVLVMSRGKILLRTTNSESASSTQHSYSFNVTNMMVPDVRVLTSYVRSDGEIIADYLSISVTLSLENQVSITPSADNVDAGTPLSIRVDASSTGAYVGIRAVDQSVLLLKSGTDLTNTRVIEDLDRYSASDDYYSDGYYPFRYFPRSSGADDAAAVFKNAGMLVLTDALVYDAPERGLSFPFHPIDVSNQEILEEFFIRHKGEGDAKKPSISLATTPRSYFPETWLWNCKLTGNNRSATFESVAPDTITSWVISAFSVSDEHGLGIAETSKVTVFRKFFVSLNLPLKVTRGEEIIVQAIVFNYFTTEEDVYVDLIPSEKAELVILGDDVEAAGARRRMRVPAEGAKSVSFPIRMNGIDNVPITVTARSDRATDTVKRNVFVRPEGIEQCYSASFFVNRRDRDEAATTGSLEIKIPPGIVDGSVKAYLYVYGEILRNTMNNLGRLLKKPSGCGEQNMLAFAPDVFVTRYLDKAGTLDPETRQKAYQHFYDGYSRELTYKHSDGSYSAFGESDVSGSTWLTAFVAKCFIFARELRPELVETRIINEALDFLVKQQKSDGTFKEPGRVIHTSMQGGVTGPITMAAYVLITLTETAYARSISGIPAAVVRTRAYLERQIETISNDPYALALVAYALRVSESGEADNALRLLEKHATSRGGMTFWHVPTPGSSSLSQQWSRPYGSPHSNDIEMTSYALLNYVAKNALNSAVPVVKWLTSKQSELGGYSSTQDTVIAVQALSAVAYLMSGQNQDLTLSATHSQDPTFDHTFHVDERNFRVFNSELVPAKNAKIYVRGTGVGIGVTQLSVCYNIPTSPFASEPFDCRKNIKSKNIRHASVNLCCRLKPGDGNATGMFLMEVGLPNGFSVNLEEEKRRNIKADLVELADTSVSYYFNQLRPSLDLCITAEMNRYADVAAAKPTILRAFEYYKSGKAFSQLYSVPGLKDVGACRVCQDCVGCSHRSASGQQHTHIKFLVSLLLLCFMLQ